MRILVASLLVSIWCSANSADVSRPRETLLNLWHLNGVLGKTGLIVQTKNVYVNESHFEGENECTLVSTTHVYDELGDVLENVNTSIVDFSRLPISQTYTSRGWFGGLVRSPEEAVTVYVRFSQRIVYFAIESEAYPQFAGEKYNDYFLFFADDEGHAKKIESAAVNVSNECQNYN